MRRARRLRIERAPLVLALATVLAAGSAAAQTASAETTGSRERSEMRTRLRETLGLTQEQEKRLEELRNLRREENRAFREEALRLRDELRELGRNPEANRKRIESLVDRMAGLRAQRTKAVLRSRIDRQRVFTPEQMEKLKAYRQGFGDRARLAGRGSRVRDRLGPGPRYGRPWLRRPGGIWRRPFRSRLW